MISILKRIALGMVYVVVMAMGQQPTLAAPSATPADALSIDEEVSYQYEDQWFKTQLAAGTWMLAGGAAKFQDAYRDDDRRLYSMA